MASTVLRQSRHVILALAGLALLSAGCTVRTDSAALATPTSDAGDHSTANTSSTTSATTTASTSSTTTSSTSSTTSSTSVADTTTSTVPTTSTTAAPPIGQFTCPGAGQVAGTQDVRPPSDIPAPELPEGWTTAVVGRSVQGRGIDVIVRPVDTPRRRVLVIGGLHGNEPVTPPAVRGLLNADIAPDVEVWLVPVANPDGSAAGLRCNANGVDLNRNFAWEWRPEDGGPAALSEPETQALALLVERLSPDVVVWVHQPLGYVSEVGESGAAIEQAWADGAGMIVRPDVTQHGGGESWSAFVAGVPSMLIEVEGWDATADMVAAQVAGFEAMVAALG